MNGDPLVGCGLAMLAFAPYPGHVSARTTRLFWFGLAVLGFAFWGFLVVVQQEWVNVRAWAGFALGVYVLYWQLYLTAIDDPEDESADE